MAFQGDCRHLAQVFTNIATVPTCFKSKQCKNTCLNYCRPVALIPIITNCFEKLVLKHIKSSLPYNFDEHQFAYRANQSTEDAIASALHLALTHLGQKGTYMRILSINYSSAFNTIVPSRLITKLGLNSTLCMWGKDFISQHSQTFGLGTHPSLSLTLSTGATQCCVLSPMVYSIYK